MNADNPVIVADNVGGIESFVGPPGAHRAERVSKRRGTVMGARPWQDLFEFRVVLIERDVDGIGGNEALNDLRIAEVLQEVGHDVNR